MHYAETTNLGLMPRSQDIDRNVRDRLRAWLLYFMQQKGLNQTDFAAFIGVSQPTVHNIVKTKEPRTMGLDVLIKLSAKCRKSMDDMVDTWPPEQQALSPPNPSAASTVGSGAGRRTAKGAQH